MNKSFRAVLLVATMLTYPALALAVDVLPTEAANAQDAALKKQIDDLSARVTALEKGKPKPPDPVPAAESPDLATVSSTDSPAAKLVGKQGHTYAIAAGKVVMDDRPVQDTAAVVMLKKVDKPTNQSVPGGVFQKNSTNDWYRPVTASTGGPPLPGDPSQTVTPPPPIGDAPAPAAAVGYTVPTARGKIVMGTTPENWRLWDGLAHVKTNADGSVTVSTGRSNGYNAHIVTAVPSAGSFLGKTWKGSCGGYYAMQFSFPGTAVQNNGWPGFWANDIENQISQGGGLAHWPNQPGGYVTSIEVDVVEWMSGNRSYGGALHHWYGIPPSGATNTEESGSPFTVPAGTNPAQPHWYGGLHVPATATTKGYFEWYFDHKKVGNRITWDKYNPNSPPPPAKGSTAYAVTDERNLYWIAGSGPSNPITIYDFQAWNPRADCTTSR